MKNNAAYDLSRFETYETAAPRVKVAEKAKTPVKRSRISVLNVVLLLAVALLMATSVSGHTELTETKAAINSLNFSLTQLQSQNAYLNYMLESSVSVKEAEEYAGRELGMIKLDDSSVRYINVQNENSIVDNSIRGGNALSDSFRKLLDIIFE